MGHQKLEQDWVFGATDNDGQPGAPLNYDVQTVEARQPEELQKFGVSEQLRRQLCTVAFGPCALLQEQHRQWKSTDREDNGAEHSRRWMHRKDPENRCEFLDCLAVYSVLTSEIWIVWLVGQPICVSFLTRTSSRWSYTVCLTYFLDSSQPINLQPTATVPPWTLQSSESACIDLLWPPLSHSSEHSWPSTALLRHVGVAENWVHALLVAKTIGPCPFWRGLRAAGRLCFGSGWRVSLDLLLQTTSNRQTAWY